MPPQGGSANLGGTIQTAELDDDAVTVAKIAQGTAGQILMSDATPQTAWTSVSGDVTISSSGVTAIGATKVTNAMLADDAVGLAEMAAGTAGNLITYDASGNPAAVATGTSGQVLTSNGAGAAPTFQAAAGGGTVVKMDAAVLGSYFETTSTTFVDITGLSLSVTPSAAATMIAQAAGSVTQTAGSHIFMRTLIDTTASGSCAISTYPATGESRPMAVIGTKDVASGARTASAQGRVSANTGRWEAGFGLIIMTVE